MANDNSTIMSIAVDNSKKVLVYQSTVLAYDKNDRLSFNIDTDGFKYNILFQFIDSGEQFSTTFFESIENSSLHYILHNWDFHTWVEISAPVLITVKDSKENYLMKFRNNSQKSGTCREFNLTIWKAI